MYKSLEEHTYSFKIAIKISYLCFNVCTFIYHLRHSTIIASFKKWQLRFTLYKRLKAKVKELRKVRFWYRHFCKIISSRCCKLWLITMDSRYIIILQCIDVLRHFHWNWSEIALKQDVLVIISPQRPIWTPIHVKGHLFKCCGS